MTQISEEQSGLRPLSDSQREMLEEATTSYEGHLLGEGEALDYLGDRGIEFDAIASARLGVVGEPAPGHERFRGMLAIPYLAEDGHPLTIRFRCMKKHDHREHFHGKYNSMPGEPARLYNVGAIHWAADNSDEIHVAEGELDAVILNQIGLPAVAVPGVNSWRPHFRRALAGFNKIWVWADRDQAKKKPTGEEDTPAGELLLTKILNACRQARPVKLPSMGDVGENYLEHGPDALLDLIPRSNR